MALTTPERRIATVLLATIGALSVVALFVLQFGVTAKLDLLVAAWMPSIRSTSLDTVMTAITMAGDSRVLLLFAITQVVILLYLRVVGLAIFCTSIMLGNVFVVYWLKQWAQRARPSPLSTGADSYSFPSAHMTMSTVVFGIAVLLVASGLSRSARKLSYFGLLLVLLGIAFSRLYLQVHWTTDVVAGALLGASSLLALLFLLARSDYMLPGSLIGSMLLVSFLVIYLIYLYTAFATVSAVYFSSLTF